LKRNEEELRIEASGYHKRQPYAVMAGILFLPFDACEDGKKNNPSSFGSWVRHLRPYAGRTAPRTMLIDLSVSSSDCTSSMDLTFASST
jgi:hypothetical protein